MRDANISEDGRVCLADLLGRTRVFLEFVRHKFNFILFKLNTQIHFNKLYNTQLVFVYFNDGSTVNHIIQLLLIIITFIVIILITIIINYQQVFLYCINYIAIAKYNYINYKKLLQEN